MKTFNTSEPEFRVHRFILNREHHSLHSHTRRMVFTNSRGLTGVGLVRKSKDEPCWEDVKDMQHGTVHQTIIDETLPGGPVERTITYVAPFTRCDREKDYRTAWTEFEKRGNLKSCTTSQLHFQSNG